MYNIHIFTIGLATAFLCLLAAETSAVELAPLPPLAASGNPSNDKLMTMPEYGQAAMLSKATHYYCLGKDPYYMGTEKKQPNQNVSFWSITCANGGMKFMVAIAPDAIGTTKVVQCNLLHGHPWECYEKLRDLK